LREAAEAGRAHACGTHRSAAHEARERQVVTARERVRAGFGMCEPTLRKSSIPHRKEHSMMWNETLVRRSKISRYEKWLSVLRH